MDYGNDTIWTTESSEETKSGEAHFSQITSGGQARLPKDIINKLSIKENNFIAFVEDKEGNIHLKKAKLRIVQTITTYKIPSKHLVNT